jgi:hypothetical protein
MDLPAGNTTIFGPSLSSAILTPPAFELGLMIGIALDLMLAAWAKLEAVIVYSSVLEHLIRKGLYKGVTRG